MSVFADFLLEILDAILLFFDGAHLVIECCCHPVILGIDLLDFGVGGDDVGLQLTEHHIMIVLEGEIATAVILLKIRDLILLDVGGVASEMLDHGSLIVLQHKEEEDGPNVRDTYEGDFTLCDQAGLWVEVSGRM